MISLTNRDRLENTLQKNPISISGEEDEEDDDTSAPGTTLVAEEKVEEGTVGSFSLS